MPASQSASQPASFTLDVVPAWLSLLREARWTLRLASFFSLFLGLSTVRAVLERHGTSGTTNPSPHAYTIYETMQLDGVYFHGCLPLASQQLAGSYKLGFAYRSRRPREERHERDGKLKSACV